MRILKAFTFVAVAGALAASSAQAQATGWFKWYSTNLGPTYTYTINGNPKTTNPSPYKAQFNIVSNPGTQYMPVSGDQWAGPAQDIFCVDFWHTAQSAAYEANFTNLGVFAGKADDFVTSGTRTHTLGQYLMAAYLSSELSNYSSTSTDPNRADIQGAIWQIMTGNSYSPSTTALRTGTASATGIAGWVQAAVTNHGNVSANEWVVITAKTAVGTDAGPQEFLVHATPEPATLLLLGTGLLATLMAAGALRRSAV